MLQWPTKAASNLVAKVYDNAKGKLSQNIQDAIWHILDTGKFLKEVEDAAFCLLGRWVHCPSKSTMHWDVLGNLMLDVPGGHENL